VFILKTRLEQVLDRYLNGREVAIWGNPTRLLMRALKNYKFNIAKNVDSKKQFVVAVNNDDKVDFLHDEQSCSFDYVKDYLTFYDFGGELPFEWSCYDAKIGRQTYFGDAYVGACEDGYIKQIGHFTSINGTAQIANDHQMNMAFVSDELAQFFNEENRSKFRNKYFADPKCPYDVNQRLLTIGNDVWIGVNSFINCSKVKNIGDGAIIGSGAVVLEDVPPYAVVVGVPAKIKRFRYNKEIIEILLQVKWWDWSQEEINANADVLMSPELFYAKYKNI